MEAKDVILVFVITAVFDVLLNLLPPPLGASILREYFNHHTVLSAALVAGFVGSVTLILILKIFPDVIHASSMACLKIFIVSALIGFPMEWSHLFPHLKTFYYDKIPRIQSFLADGLSGVMVASVFWTLKYFLSNKKNEQSID